MKTIGLIGGMSWESTTLYCQTTTVLHAMAAVDFALEVQPAGSTAHWSCWTARPRSRLSRATP